MLHPTYSQHIYDGALNSSMWIFIVNKRHCVSYWRKQNEKITLQTQNQHVGRHDSFSIIPILSSQRPWDDNRNLGRVQHNSTQDQNLMFEACWTYACLGNYTRGSISDDTSTRWGGRGYHAHACWQTCKITYLKYTSHLGIKHDTSYCQSLTFQLLPIRHLARKWNREQCYLEF